MAIRKELLLQSRDIGGLIILFVMPMVLLVTITMVQKGSFDSITGTRIPVLLVDNDLGEIAETVRKELGGTGNFEVVERVNGIAFSEIEAKDAVFRGDYQLAIVLPPRLSDDLNLHIKQNVDKVMAEFSYTEADSTKPAIIQIQKKDVNLYFDPATQESFKTAIKSSIDKLIATIEKDKVYKVFQEELGVNDEAVFDQGQILQYREIGPDEKGNSIKPSAVQHNVPAWSLFAIFFIVVPLSINIVKEKSQGTMIRLITNPVPYTLFLLGKTFTYLLVSLIQFYLMLIVGVYVFPLLDLPSFEVADNFLQLSTMALFAGLAAIGFGILLGTIATTQEQSAPFGATFVVILAAVGGVWVPVFVMPTIMQTISNLSPMNWALNGFYDILLRQGSWTAILPQLILLFLFFILTLLIAVLYDKKKRTI
ncbi:ABC-2 type transport system permease protein [Sphingobacterium nematocida]|uniref:ABC-2 type transport system permease protein n=2 Tax=Sphingobacterium nematocida TaxID=1513896 RepID=A0A1T5EQV4_9SPHI|nr:ABC-2 type transport system permease protein [Sphingobacterium nematocida]